MPYRLLDDSAETGIECEAWEDTLTGLLTITCDAVMNVVLEDITEIDDTWTADFSLENAQLDKLLSDLIRKQLAYLETGRLLLRARNIRVFNRQDTHHLTGEFYGEIFDPDKHELLVDLKAKNLARCTLEQKDMYWYMRVAFDV